MRRQGRVVGLVAVGGLVLGLAASLVLPAAAAFRDAGSWRHTRVSRHLSVLAERSTVVAADGSVIGRLGRTDRAVVHRLGEVPRSLLDAVIATEDRSFWTNGGIDLPAAGRALVRNVHAGRVEQGGSTITQQLVKNRILTPHRSLHRKLHEAVLAYRLAHEVPKRKVLLAYLNTVYFGEGAHGVRVAAERIAGKPLGELTLADSALLAGLIAAPASYNPFEQPVRARDRRAEVLQSMVDQGFVTPRQAAAAAAAPLRPASERPVPDLRPRDYFVAEVQRRLLRDERLGQTPRERERRLLQGGLRIVTTLDPKMQWAAISAVGSTVPASPFTAALAAVDPRTGAVRAMVGGPDFQTAQYDLATQGVRQPGSTFKMITLATALENGYSPEDRVNGSAGCSIPMPDGQAPWTPGGHGAGTMTLRAATEQSINCAYARLIAGLGAAKVAAEAQLLGVNGPVPPWPSITLGSVEASPLEMATVAATFAADGTRHDPYLVSRVEDPNGRVILENEPAGHPVVSPQTARTVVDVLSGVISRGTGTAARIDRPAFGKTGSTDDNADAWFVGGTPQLVAAVWMGSPAGRVPMTNVGGRVVYGGTYPAQIWQRFMTAALAGAPVVGFPPPDPAAWPAPMFAGERGRVATSPSRSRVRSLDPAPAEDPAPAPDGSPLLAPDPAPADTGGGDGGGNGGPGP